MVKLVKHMYIVDVQDGFDFLHFYDGPTTSDPLIETMTGTGYATPYTDISSTGSTMVIQFTSDGSIPGVGIVGDVHRIGVYLLSEIRL